MHKLATGIIEYAVERFLDRLEPIERMALSSSRLPKAELRQIKRLANEVHPVIVFECDSLAHRAALLCLKSRLVKAAALVGIPGICFTVKGEKDIGFFC